MIQLSQTELDRRLAQFAQTHKAEYWLKSPRAHQPNRGRPTSFTWYLNALQLRGFLRWLTRDHMFPESVSEEDYHSVMQSLKSLPKSVGGVDLGTVHEKLLKTLEDARAMTELDRDLAGDPAELTAELRAAQSAYKAKVDEYQARKQQLDSERSSALATSHTAKLLARKRELERELSMVKSELQSTRAEYGEKKRELDIELSILKSDFLDIQAEYGQKKRELEGRLEATRQPKMTADTWDLAAEARRYGVTMAQIAEALGTSIPYVSIALRKRAF